ncbi:MAG TPA: hypothetical protein VJ866_15845 [Pyrinomonadaceae bacterium]|nr:hypothetical protein [Pyrinomonadaceae bacterium]
MNRRLWKFSSAAALACAFVLFAQASASAQQQQGRATGGPGSPGLNQAMGRTNEVAAGRSNGSVNVGAPTWPNVPNVSNNRLPYEYANQARIRAENERHADKELREHPDMPARLNTTAQELREGYREMHRYNILLTFEQYVTAARLAAVLIPTHPNITRTGLLNGIGAGKSFEQTLRDRGFTKEEAKAAVQRVKQEIKESRRRN